MFARLPLRGAYLLVIGLAPIWFLHYNRPRYGLIRAMRRMGLRLPWWRALGAYGAYTLALVDRYYIRSGRLAVHLEPGGREALDVALAEPSPLVFLGSHCGSMELAVPALESMGRTVRAVAVQDPSAGRLLSGVGDAAADVGGAASTIVADGTAAAGLRMLAALRKGEVLAFKADRFLPGSSPDQRVEAELFGEPAQLPRGPAEVVRISRARAWAISAFRTGPGRFRLLADPVDVSSRDAAEITRTYARVLQRHVLAQPNQWFNFFPYWPRDVADLGWLPETVPPGMRAGVSAVWGGLVAGVVAGLLGLTAPGGAIGVGLLGGFLAALLGMSLGAAVDFAGVRNRVARAVAVTGPAFAVGLLLVQLGDALTTGDLAAGLAGLVAGAVAGNISRSAAAPRPPGAPASADPTP